MQVWRWVAMHKFGFIAHPIDVNTFYDFFGSFSRLARLVPEQVIRSITPHLPPYTLCSFDRIRSSDGLAICGDVVTVPLMPIQIASLPEERVLRAIEKGIAICERSGAKIVGLGGFTSVVGNEGEVLSKRVHVPLTSGNTLTAALALEGIYKAAHLMDTVLADATVAVIGATGDIGSICTKIVSKKAKRLTIAARNETKLQEFAATVRSCGRATVEVFKYSRDAVKDADIVLTATSAVSTVIDPANLRPGAIVCDVAIPANIAREVARVRDDVFVFEGGLARIPHHEDLKSRRLSRILPEKGVYGCIAETMTLAFEGLFEPYSIGRGAITEEKVARISALAKKHGIELSDFFCGHAFYTDEDIERIRRNADRSRERDCVVQR